MWGIATQAGAGVAIAGLTATYYALASRNSQGEAELMAHEKGHGDGPDVGLKDLDFDDDEDREKEKGGQQRQMETPLLQSSNRMLKKELQELSFLNGSISGLNIIYQGQNPLKFPRSTFEISRVNSRTSANSSAYLSPPRPIFKTVAEGKSDDTDQTEIPNRPMAPIPMPPMEAYMELSEESLETLVERKVKESDLDESPNRKQYGEEKLKAIPLTRSSSSPVCFFKNPGFGNRYAFKMKHGANPLVARASQLKMGAGDGRDPSTLQLVPSGSDKEYRDSTQFIMSPVLSESNVSIFEKGIPEKLRIKAEQDSGAGHRFDKFLGARASELTDPTNAISIYNEKLRQRRLLIKSKKNKSRGRIRFRVDPVRTRSSNVSKPSGKPVLPIGTSYSRDNCKVNREDRKAGDTTTYGGFFGETLDDYNNPPWKRYLEGDTPTAGVIEEPVILPSEVSSSQLRLFAEAKAKEDTQPVPELRDLSARVFNNAVQTMPWPLVGVCVLIVVIAGILGFFLTRWANTVSTLSSRRLW